MEKILFVSSFRYLFIDGEPDDHFTLLPGINISNSMEKKKEILDNQLIFMLGGIEFDHLLNSPNIIFCEFEKGDLPGADLEPFLLAILLWIKELFRST